ncbi:MULTISPECIES: hypothetical protein [Brachybacterium]|uniref:hypothetical protein n=1 Tax=Brachybacterium TaxID=43668 RepID=UPI0006C5F01E|nr:MULTISPECIES: hypothetical protein [Brachybacterium]GAP77937.1 hypothetical protein Y09_0755 [Brachybacterium sp. SW0106-09]
MPGPDPAPATSTTHAPARAWLRPALLLVGGALLTLLMVLADQLIAALAVGAFSLFMASWTSPLRSGPHTPLASAQERARGADGTAPTIVLWAPGDPASARLQAAIRAPREDLIWVNVFKDPAAQQLLGRYGGERMLPLALQGEDAARIDNVSELFAFQDRARPDGAPGGAAGAGPTTPDPGADPSGRAEERGEDEPGSPRA